MLMGTALLLAASLTPSCSVLRPAPSPAQSRQLQMVEPKAAGGKAGGKAGGASLRCSGLARLLQVVRRRPSRTRPVMAMFETPPPPGFEWAGASEGAGEHTADEHHARPKTYTVAELRRQGERAIAQREAWQPTLTQFFKVRQLRKEGEQTIARRVAIGKMLKEKVFEQRFGSKTVWPTGDGWIDVLGAGLGGPVDAWGKDVPPSWADLTQVPVRVPNQAAWDSLGLPKQLAVLSRLSVVHLTVISCAAPCLLAAATGAATSGGAALLWVATLVLWHLSHNLINDAQDLQKGLDQSQAFRLQYGTHALAEGLVSRRTFGTTLAALSAASVAGSVLLARSVAPACAWAFPVGLAATLLYTPVAKPFGLGELLVLLVWGPAMFGGGWSAATGAAGLQLVRSLPVSLGAFGMIMGKHIDKLDECREARVRTLPVLLGDGRARALAAAALVGQHVSLVALVAAGALPRGALLALACVPFELRHALAILGAARPAAPAEAKPRYGGSMLPMLPKRAWPLWYVAAAGWHAVTFGYWLMLGVGLSWGWRAIRLAVGI